MGKLLRSVLEWMASVNVERGGSSNDVHYVAECPVCGYTHSVDVRTNDNAARVLAAQNIQNHIVAKHPDQITEVNKRELEE